MTPRVFVVGAGRAGVGLTRALRASGVDVVGVHGRRNAGGVDGVTVGSFPPSLSAATVVLVTVRDAQLDEALAGLYPAPLAPGAVVLHASGSSDPAGLAPLRRAGHPAGTLHPLVPLADPSRAAALLRGAWIGIDGDPAARDAARALARALGAHTVEIPAGAKARYHAAAVIASNFPVVLFAVAERAMSEAGIDATAAREAVRTLVLGAAENLRDGDATAVLTGPVVRGDVDTVRAHLAALAADEDALAVYCALSRAALDLARDAGASPERLAEIGALVEASR